MTSSPNPYASLYEFVRKDRHGYTVVFTNGCFDLLHPGHLKVLRRCRDMAGWMGVVVVGVNTDESIRRLKGPNRPILPLAARLDLLKGLCHVNYAVAFDEDTPRLLIEAIRPNFIVKGGDYKAYEVVGQDIAHVDIVDLDGEWSTSKIIEKIKNG